jgi:hypothetical protein
MRFGPSSAIDRLLTRAGKPAFSYAICGGSCKATHFLRRSPPVFIEKEVKSTLVKKGDGELLGGNSCSHLASQVSLFYE